MASFDRKLTNTLSHELLTPLNSIINLADCLMFDQAASSRAPEAAQVNQVVEQKSKDKDMLQ